MVLKDKNLYYVGGVVRDEILGAQSFDTDYCYLGNAIEFAQNLNVIKTNPDFGTVRVLYEGKEIDIASTREEYYPNPGHLPVIRNIGCSLEKDLIRRDFGVNAIAKNTLTGELFDPLNGIDDIKNKKLRVLHNESFIDDPTRIVRALKFSVRFGFELEHNTKILRDNYLENINYDMSYHRLKKELIETFNLNKAEAFDKFVDENIYNLLGKNQKKPPVTGTQIQNAVEENNIKEPWLIYMSFFDLSNLPMSRQEKKLLEWVGRLETQSPTNNTPDESIVIYNIKRQVE